MPTIDKSDDHAPLPWVVVVNHPGDEGYVMVVAADGSVVTCTGDMEDCTWRDICDAQFIAHAANNYESLLAALEALLDNQRGLNLAQWQAAVAAGQAAIAQARAPIRNSLSAAE